MKLVLTGGSGFIGGEVLRRLVGSPISLRALVHNEDGARRLSGGHTALEVLPLHGHAEDLFRGCDVFLHAGWSSVPSTAEQDPVADLRNNVEQGLRLFQAAAAAGVSRIIFLSSGGTVYGEPQWLPISEDHPTIPVGSYGAAKLCLERYLHVVATRSNMEHIVLRPANVYGRAMVHERPQGVVEHWLMCALRNQSMEAWNSLDMVRDYIHVDDLVDAVIASLTTRTAHTVFNVGTGVGTSLQRLAEMIVEQTGTDQRVVRVLGRSGRRPGVITANVLDPARASAQLGVVAKTPLAEGLAATLSRLRDNTVA